MDLFEDALDAGTISENPYAPPPLVRRTMAELEAVPFNGLHFVGSFSGCGGSSLGLRSAGWHPLAAVEFVPAAAATYQANFPHTRIYETDIRELDPETILADLGLRSGELDLFEGSPPCASFSAAGSREKGWGKVKSYSGTKQATDDLFWEWKRVLAGLMPRAFIAENVPGLAMGSALEEYAWKISSELSELGYSIDASVLNAAAYGVPQARRRLIFIGFRNDRGISASTVFERIRARALLVPNTLRQALESVEPNDPDHAPYLADSSIEGSAIARARDVRLGDRTLGDCAFCRTSFAAHLKDASGTAVCADGEKAIEVKDYFMLKMPDLDKPILTFTATAAQRHSASVVHPFEARKFTPAEAKALSGFPADFQLTGSREERIERIGRTVTPPVYEACGIEIAKALRGEE